MSMRKTTAEAFNRRVRRLTIARGAEPAKVYPDERLVLQTAAGSMFIWPSTSPSRLKRGGLYTVFCRFEDVPRAVDYLKGRHGLNNYTGKYNFHMSGGDDDLQSAVEAFAAHLDTVSE